MTCFKVPDPLFGTSLGKFSPTLKRPALKNSDKRKNPIYSLHFDGIDDYVTVPDSSSLDINNSITIAAWIKRSNIPESFATIIDKFGVGSSSSSYLLRLDSAGHPNFILSSTGTYDSNYDLLASAVISNDVLTHLAATSDNTGTMKIYIDGILDVNTKVAPSSIYQGNEQLEIGRRENGTLMYRGVLEDIRIYNRDLISSEISSLFSNVDITSGLVLYHNYKRGNANDLSGNGNNGTIYGANFEMDYG